MKTWASDAIRLLERARADARSRSIDLGPLTVLLARIRERYDPEQVWLFGSRARGDAGPGSDWDLFVVLPDEAPEGDLNPLTAWRLQKNSGVYADIIPSRTADFHQALGTVNTLPYVIATEGVLIYERGDADREPAEDREGGSRRSASAGSQR